MSLLSITAEEWQRVGALFDRLSTLPPQQRDLDNLDEPPAVRSLLERMLQAHDSHDPETLSATFDGAIEAALGIDEAPGEPPMRTTGDFGPWRATGEIGQGGMGVVLHGERADGQFEKHVAIKLLPVAGSRSERLREEIRILARLEHQHIAWLLDGGISEDGIPYLVMEFVPGTPINRYCREHSLKPAQIALLFEQVVEAVRFAHRHLIVHCDLKPANILVTEDGQVKLVDFGIAGLITSGAHEHSRARSLMCSPAYAAPEQLAGEQPATSQDIFSLGAVLYELLCGKRIRDATSATQLIFGEPVDDAPPDPPSSFNPRVDADLDAICRRALSRDPDQRFPTASALLADLKHWRTDLPVAAREGGAAYRVRKWLRRNWLPATAGAATALALVIGAGLAFWQAHEAKLAHTAAETELERATALNQFVVSLFEGARIGFPRDQVPTTRELLIKGMDSARSQFAEQPELQGRMLAMIGRLLNSVGLSAESREVLAEALEIQSRLYHPQEVTLARTRLEYGQALHFSDQFDAAIDELLRSAEVLRDSAQPADLSRALHALGFALSERQIFAKALASHEEALAIDKAGGDKTALGLGQSATARTLARADRLEEAERLYQEALEHLRADPALEPYVLAQVLSDYGVTLRQLDHLRRAEAVLRESISISESVYTGPHSSMAQRWNNLGSVLVGLGDRPAAIEAFGHAMTILEAIPGDANRSILAGPLNNLGYLNMSIGEYDRAADFFRESLSLLEASTGRNHRHHIAVSGNLGRALTRKGDFQQAQALLEDALARSREHYEPADAPVTGLLAALGQSRWLNNRDPQGRAMIKEAYDRALTANGAGHAETARRALDLAETMAQVPDPGAARPLYEQALRYSVETLPPAHQQVLTTRVGLAESFLALGDESKAGDLIAPLDALPPHYLAETDPLGARLAALRERLE